MRAAAAVGVPLGLVLVVHELCRRLGVPERDALAAAFLVWSSCAGALLLILAAIAENHRPPN